MRKYIIIIMLVGLISVQFASCSKTYNIGDVGPAGGYIFYDCDADNKSGNYDGLISTECGWRYLEAAPTDLDGSTVETTYRFGYYRTSSSGSNLTIGTGTAIGTGKANTDVLVKAMGETTYPRERGADKETYAAKACSDYSITVDGTVYDDWFLPSKDELNLMYENLYKKGLGSFASNYYWSSSEDSSYYAWRQSFGNGSQYDYNRGSNYSVRPVRAFK